MADTLPDIPLPANQWVDLYTESSILVGTQIITNNKGSSRIILATQATEPTTLDGVVCDVNESSINENGDSGAWAYSANVEGRVNVQVAP